MLSAALTRGRGEDALEACCPPSIPSAPFTHSSTDGSQVAKNILLQSSLGSWKFCCVAAPHEGHLWNFSKWFHNHNLIWSAYLLQSDIKGRYCRTLTLNKRKPRPQELQSKNGSCGEFVVQMDSDVHPLPPGPPLFNRLLFPACP